MNRKTIVVAAAVGALAVSGGTAWALGSADPQVSVTPAAATTSAPTSPSTTSTVADARLSAGDAADLVRKRLGGGVVHEVEAEYEHGRAEWEVEITKAGVRYDIRIDANTGVVTRIEVDSRRGDDRLGDDRVGDDRVGDDHGRHGDDDPPGDDHGGDHGGDDHSGHGGGGDDDDSGDDHSGRG